MTSAPSSNSAKILSEKDFTPSTEVFNHSELTGLSVPRFMKGLIPSPFVLEPATLELFEDISGDKTEQALAEILAESEEHLVKAISKVSETVEVEKTPRDSIFRGEFIVKDPNRKDGLTYALTLGFGSKKLKEDRYLALTLMSPLSELGNRSKDIFLWLDLEELPAEQAETVRTFIKEGAKTSTEATPGAFEKATEGLLELLVSLEGQVEELVKVSHARYLLSYNFMAWGSRDLGLASSFISGHAEDLFNY